MIDEAEMLLEARSRNEVIRNAMVCVMLRLIEYYTGILFLTTNRISALDPAFQSRVQCTLEYPPLNQASRKVIWKNLLEKVNLTLDSAVNLDELASHN